MSKVIYKVFSTIVLNFKNIFLIFTSKKLYSFLQALLLYLLKPSKSVSVLRKLLTWYQKVSKTTLHWQDVWSCLLMLNQSLMSIKKINWCGVLLIPAKFSVRSCYKLIIYRRHSPPKCDINWKEWWRLNHPPRLLYSYGKLHQIVSLPGLTWQDVESLFLIHWVPFMW